MRRVLSVVVFVLAVALVLVAGPAQAQTRLPHEDRHPGPHQQALFTLQGPIGTPFIDGGVPNGVEVSLQAGDYTLYAGSGAPMLCALTVTARGPGTTPRPATGSSRVAAPRRS